MGHATLSPSGAERWATCTASVQQEAGLPDEGSDAARWGTACHLLSETCLRDEFQMDEPANYLGCKVLFTNDGEILHDGFSEVGDVQHTVEVDQEQVDCATAYVNFVREIVVNTGGQLHIEVRVPIGHITGEEDAGGTSDCVIDSPDEFMVVDLKGGMVEVEAYYQFGLDLFTGEPQYEPNKQLAMYADGALLKLRPELREKLDHPVRLVVVQPRKKNISEYRTTVGDLLAFTEKLRAAAEEVRTNPTHRPSLKACNYCKASGDCQGQREFLEQTFGSEVPEDQLGAFYDRVPLMLKVAKAVEAKVRAKLVAGEQVIGKDGPYKLVEGRMGARKFTDEDEAEKLIKGFRLKQEDVYNITLKTPTQLEEVLKDSPRRWSKLEPLILQERGQPAVVPATHKKPALQAEKPTDGFTFEPA